MRRADVDDDDDATMTMEIDSQLKQSSLSSFDSNGENGTFSQLWYLIALS